MEPIPETTEVVEEFGPFTEDDLLEDLRKMGQRVRAIVPDCIGFSLASNADGVIFTLVATEEELAVLDAVQYLAGGPCVDSVRAEKVVEYHSDDPLDEEMWRMFAQASSATDVVCTLTLPVMVDGRVSGSVNLYGASRRAFAGHHEELAQIFGAWASGAVTNADLSFSTRSAAEQAPERLRNDVLIEVAVGIVAAAYNVGLDAAREKLRDAAQRGGVSEGRLARTIVDLRPKAIEEP
jgi:GAF domain-containing protein